MTDPKKKIPAELLAEFGLDPESMFQMTHEGKANHTDVLLDLAVTRLVDHQATIDQQIEQITEDIKKISQRLFRLESRFGRC